MHYIHLGITYTDSVRLPCNRGYSTPLEYKCLYNTDESGHILGCSSMVHLFDCGKYTCITVQKKIDLAELFFSKLNILNTKILS